MFLLSFLKFVGYIPFNLVYLFRTKYIGGKNMPKEGPVIVCCNHISAADPLFLICLFKRQIRFMGKAEVFKGRFLNWFFRNVGVFPVKRGEADLEAVKTSIRILRNNEVLGIFPEGHRQSDDNNRDEAHPGVAMFAAKTKATVLPVAITAKNNKIRAFSKVVVKCGEPISYEELGFNGLNNDEYKRVSKEIMDRIYKIKAEIDI